MADILCIGHFCADVIGKPIDVLPQKGTLAPVRELLLSTGGCANNCAHALAKLGQPVSVMGKVGVDGFGEYVEMMLKRAGIDTRGLMLDPGVTSSATMVFVDSTGERSFYHHYGANALFTDTDVNYDLVAEAKYVSINTAFLLPAMDGEPMARVLKRAREMGKFTVLDTAWDPTGRWMDAIAPCLPYVDLFIPSFEEAEQLAGTPDLDAMCDLFLAGGARHVVVKHGKQGCFIKDAELRIEIPAFLVDAVDATGAGDCFVAGFLCGLARGLTLPQCAMLANAVGAHCVTAVGATVGIPKLERVLAFLRERGVELPLA